MLNFNGSSCIMNKKSSLMDKNWFLVYDGQINELEKFDKTHDTCTAFKQRKVWAHTFLVIITSNLLEYSNISKANYLSKKD
jgi:hypothetical protein